MSEAGLIGFAGLSHLGIIQSIAAVARGHSVVACDERPGVADDLSAGRFPISEPELENAFREHGRRIRYSADMASLAACRLIFITLDVQTDDSNNSNLAALEALIERVCASASPRSVLVLMSQVPPGFCRKLAPRLPPRLRLYYQVETLVFGNAVKRAVFPERFMIGCPEAPADLPELYLQYLATFDCPLLPMRYESAELCKIAINCFLVSSVATSNTLAEICEKIGADWSEIIPALRLDQRIGPHAYLSPGLGIAGGNLERDLVTVQSLAAEYGCDARVVTAWQEHSSYRRDWVLRKLSSLGLTSEVNLAIWGLAYKAGTHSIKNSPSLALIRALAGFRLSIYDPAVKLNAQEFPGVIVCDSALAALKDADMLVIMTPWKEFAEVPLTEVKPLMRGPHLLDPFGALDGEACRRLGFDYHRLGI